MTDIASRKYSVDGDAGMLFRNISRRRIEHPGTTRLSAPLTTVLLLLLELCVAWASPRLAKAQNPSTIPTVDDLERQLEAKKAEKDRVRVEEEQKRKAKQAAQAAKTASETQAAKTATETQAAPVQQPTSFGGSSSDSYTIDPYHTYPSFAADHFGGLSVWRGKFRKSSGQIVYNAEHRTGRVDVIVDTSSIDFGHAKLNEHAKSPEMFDVARFPVAQFQGEFDKWSSGAPTQVSGRLDLHGITKPVTLSIRHFKCMINPMSKKEVCGADAYGTINRAEFGINFGEKYGFGQTVSLEIQVEAARDN